ncbi:HNH endonuclease [Rhizobium tubonense]|uniref:HNH endonuclease n=1 Tax=Rhizobium tubonense TaxID=484088 RepID=UPI0018A87F94|nr:HNH endonuclease [Rhizobium tubonense]
MGQVIIGGVGHIDEAAVEPEPALRLSSDIEKSLRFYFEHYDMVRHHVLKPGEKIVISLDGERLCRFCGKGEPAVSFRNLAHAIPESLGNKALSTTYECDTCNKEFGEGIETHLGHWSKPMRYIARIKGKKRFPQLEESGGKGWKMEYDPKSGFQIKSYEDDPVATVNGEARQLGLTIRRKPYIPLAVLKAFWKMAVTLMPEDELENFKDVRRWIMTKTHESIGGPIQVFVGFHPGPMPPGFLGVALLMRRSADTRYPYAFIAIRYGNETFQVPVPSALNDAQGTSDPIPFFRFPDLVDPNVYGKSKFFQVDLSSIDPMSDPVNVTFQAETVDSTQHEPTSENRYG